MSKQNSHADQNKLDEVLKPSSNFHVSKLTPRSEEKRMKNNSQKRRDLSRRINIYKRKLQDMEIQLNDEQITEIETGIVEWITNNDVNSLETIFCERLGEGLKHGIGTMKTESRSIGINLQMVS